MIRRIGIDKAKRWPVTAPGDKAVLLPEPPQKKKE